MQLVKPESASHWYDLKDGTWIPMYELPKKSGDGMKKVTLREAKELNLKPSVTSILDIINKPGLQAWKQEQAILAALTLPKLSDEPLDAFVERVIEDMDAQSEKARSFGSEIHAAIEGYLKEGRVIPENIAPFLQSFVEWGNKEVHKIIGTEVVCGCEECGYAGRLDLVCVLKDFGFSVIDAKTQNVRRDKKGIKQPVFYADTFPRQLAAYAHTFCPHSEEKVVPAMVSVIIDSSEPGPVYVKKWDNYQHHLKMFQHCLELWCDDRGYRPMKI